MYTLKQRRRWDSLHSELNFFSFFLLSFWGFDLSRHFFIYLWSINVMSHSFFSVSVPKTISWVTSAEKEEALIFARFSAQAIDKLQFFYVFFFYWGKRKTELSVQLQWRRRTQMLPSSGRSGQRYAPGEFDLSPSLATLLITSWQETAVDDSIEKK